MGNKQSEKFFSYYSLWGTHSIDKSLAKYGFHRDDITDVFMTHLHFDHCGGSVQWNKDKTGYEVAFKNAKFWTNENHWEWATKPNPREKASFLHDTDFLEKSELGFGVFFVDGHTEKMMIPHIEYQGKTICFMADLLPTAGHIPLPYVMGYDTRPLITLTEKEKFMNAAADNNYYLFLEHDAHHEIITVEKTEKGVRLKDVFKSEDLFNN
jgi:glyoxylase-like metal-dependent hydrolase (beta-lactamase superfamily II)